MKENIELIWREYHDILLTFIQKRVIDKTVAEDILQDVFMKIHSKIQTLRDTSKLQSWLYQITRNAINDYYRNNEKINKISQNGFDLNVEEENKSMKEAEGWINIYIQSLPDKYREALILSDLEGVSQKEIANRLNISYPNARSRVQRGRKILRERLTDCCKFNVDVYGNILDYKIREDNCGCDNMN